uniref:Interferon alpha n=1 Tax=Gallus gallus TaxID=9031 RepID=Q9PWI5_CHICK|nr:interferon alpha [Gallus gallus]|eukprot:XP_015132926.1 interferon type A3 [Gallus gallus]
MAVPASPQHPRGYGILLLTLLLKALATTASACNHLRPQDATFSHDSLQLFRDMAPTLLQLCPQHNASCSFNDTILDTSNTQQADKTTHDILQHLFKILSSPSTPAHWNDSQRQSLLNRIHRYTQHLEQCLDSRDTRSRTRWPRNLHLTIKKHFSCLHTFLQDNDYSACAWEHVRLQARAWFLHIHNLTGNTRT